ncbi:class II fructose-bisphosphate aldolase family protein [Candidatus Microgenomates bacterium]|nr:class II fructose-bisphosphate aldolase family protein [Candidatus Microgenomates bacterium]
MKEFLNKAWQNHFAIGAFNIDSFETLKAVSNACQKLNAPVLIEVSPGEVEFLGMRNLASVVDNIRREFGVPIFINLDHADNIDNIEKALDFCFDLVHFDGGKLPIDENISRAKRVVEMAHRVGAVVEGEIDHFVGSSELHATASEVPQLTDPENARRFVETTGVDIFAVSIGNKHGYYADGSKKLHLDHLQKIKEVLPDTYFSLHGGSGAPNEDVQSAIELGVVKVNINSELRIAWKTGLMRSLVENAREYTWSKIVSNPVSDVQKVIEEKIKLFGSNDKI